MLVIFWTWLSINVCEKYVCLAYYVCLPYMHFVRAVEFMAVKKYSHTQNN